MKAAGRGEKMAENWDKSSSPIGWESWILQIETNWDKYFNLIGWADLLNEKEKKKTGNWDNWDREQVFHGSRERTERSSLCEEAGEKGAFALARCEAGNPRSIPGWSKD